MSNTESSVDVTLDELAFGLFQDADNKLLVVIQRLPSTLGDLGKALAEILDALLDAQEDLETDTEPLPRDERAGYIIATLIREVGLDADDDDDDDDDGDGELD